MCQSYKSSTRYKLPSPSASSTCEREREKFVFFKAKIRIFYWFFHWFLLTDEFSQFLIFHQKCDSLRDTCRIAFGLIKLINGHATGTKQSAMTGTKGKKYEKYTLNVKKYWKYWKNRSHFPKKSVVAPGQISTASVLLSEQLRVLCESICIF